MKLMSVLEMESPSDPLLSSTAGLFQVPSFHLHQCLRFHVLQVQIIIATFALHNYIRMYSNGVSEEEKDGGSDNEGAEHEPLPNSSSNLGEEEPHSIRAVRDEIANMIWSTY